MEIIIELCLIEAFFFGNLGKFKANFTQGQIWWARIGQGNLSLSLMFYSPVGWGRLGRHESVHPGVRLRASQ